jgi:hypothetical protein
MPRGSLLTGARSCSDNARLARVSGDRRRGWQYATVAGDDPPLEQHQFVRGVCCDRLRDTAGRDREEGGRAADRHTVIGDAECLGTGGADQIEGGRDLVVAAEITLPPDDRGAFEEVAGAVGDQVSRMSSLPAKTRTPAARSIPSGGRVRPPAPWVTRATPLMI